MNFIGDIVVILIVLGMVYLVRVSNEFTNKLKQKAKDEKQNNLSLLFKKIEKLEEEIFCLKHNIEFDSSRQEISYNLDKPFLNYGYHIEIEYFVKSTEFKGISGRSMDSFYSDMIRAKILIDAEIMKEVELSRPFYSVSEIYDYLDSRIKDYDYDIFLSKQLAESKQLVELS